MPAIPAHPSCSPVLSTPLPCPPPVSRSALTPSPSFYSGDATYNVSSSPTITYQVLDPVVTGGFTLSPATAALTAQRLGSANPTLVYQVTPNGGFTGIVQFSCTNLPVNTACVFTPGSVNISGTGDVTATLTLVLNTGITASVFSRGPLTGLAFAALFGLTFRRRRRFAALCALIAITAITGCGGGYNPGSSSPGVYKVNVIATSGSITQTSILTLTIQ